MVPNSNPTSEVQHQDVKCRTTNRLSVQYYARVQLLGVSAFNSVQSITTSGTGLRSVDFFLSEKDPTKEAVGRQDVWLWPFPEA
eukprot:2114345-Amphidinium_carterae.1